MSFVAQFYLLLLLNESKSYVAAMNSTIMLPSEEEELLYPYSNLLMCTSPSCHTSNIRSVFNFTLLVRPSSIRSSYLCVPCHLDDANAPIILTDKTNPSAKSSVFFQGNMYLDDVSSPCARSLSSSVVKERV